ncbi:PGM [Symbiodinium natans]|uniref:PGM protein n=1 Tax=Symbiodinium natans TaxID=878477 RepID=A0A812VCN8_9DINO|nr:PGM [Symbiodinium natans]
MAPKAHDAGEMGDLRAAGETLRASLGFRARLVAAADGATPPEGAKKVHFIRHGEGFHNVAQREWRAKPDWDGKSEPYTLDQDPDGKFEDPLLTPKGEGQAKDLQPRVASLAPELLVVSPMRRATQTALIAFERQVAGGELPVLAHELCHERAGRHTCDRRLPKTKLAALYPAVDYKLIDSEEDPYWGDGWTREDLPTLAARAAGFIDWLLARPERHVAVAAHSALLLAVFNAACECECADTRSHFETGEMRTVLLSVER